MKKFLGFCGNDPGRRPLHWPPNSTTDQDGFFMECSGHIFKETDEEGVKLFGDIGVYEDTGSQFLLRTASAIEKGQMESVFLNAHGKWAFAAIDCRQRKVILGRDRRNSRQIYFAQVADGFVFGTRLLEVAKASGAQEYNWDALNGYQQIFYNIESNGQTPIKGVAKIPPGHYLVWEKGSYRLIRWWNTLEHLPVIPKGIKRQSAELLRLLSRSIKRQADAIDGPIGVTVSGGMDSSSVFALLMQDRSLRQRVRPFSITNPGLYSDEAPRVSDLMEMYQHPVEWIEPKMPRSDLYNALKSFLTIVEGPIGNPAFYIQRELYDTIKETGIDGVMNGSGGGGFGDYYFNLHAAYIELLKQRRYIASFHAYEARCHALEAYSAGPMVSDSLKERIRMLKDFLGTAEFIWAKPFNSAAKTLKTYGAANKAQTPEATVWPYMNSRDFIVAKSTISTIRPPEGFRNSVLFRGLEPYDRIQGKVLLDVGIESHGPLSDWEIATFLMALPITSLVNRRSKYIIRYAMRDMLPQSILTNSLKVGMQASLVDWMNDPVVRSQITDIVCDRSFTECPLIEGRKFQYAWLSFLKRELTSGDCGAVWQVLNLFIWDRIVRDNTV